LTGDVTSSVVAVFAAFVVGALLIAALGADPFEAYTALLDGAIGNRNSVAETLTRATPLALAGVGTCIAFRAGAFNIGAEGQLYLGGTAAAWAALALSGAPTLIALPTMGLAALAAGAMWSGAAAILKLRFGANELITTIMLSYIAIFLVAYLLHGPMQDPGSPLGQTARLSREASLPVILPRTRLNLGFLIALISAALAHLFLRRTVWGYRIRLVGLNSRAAANAGIDPRPVVFASFLLSGSLAGLAGFVEVAGVQHRMIENLSPGYGYTAIMVALLGRTAPLGALLAAFLFAALQVGATTMEAAAHVPGTIATIVQALVVLFLIARDSISPFRRRVT
jgi:simple sugar transport system permease protein